MSETECGHDMIRIYPFEEKYVRVVCFQCNTILVDKASFASLDGIAAREALALWRPEDK